MSAPPMDPYQQGMPPVPPSYDAAMSIAPPAGYPGSGYPPGQPGPPGQVYPPLPEKSGGPPPPQAMQYQPQGGMQYQQGMMQPPPQGMMQPQPPVQVVTQVQYVAGPSFGHRPVTMVCPHCQKNITTRTNSEPSALAWIIGGVMCLVGLGLCACIPCCIDSLNQVTHSCPACSNTLGRYKGGL